MRASNPRMLQVLSPYGNWNHPRGMQIVNRSSANSMRAAFNSAFSKLCGKKLPIYIGHPDDKVSGKALPKPVGYIREILETDDGIAVETEYEEKTYADIVSGKYVGLSPRWEMEHICADKYSPVRLISAGLTNSPNIPDSGRILSTKKNYFEPANLSGCINSAKKTADRCGKIFEKAKSCLHSAEGNAANLQEGAMRTRIKNRVSVDKTNDSRKKISPAKLSQMALERSSALSEPYSRSFAILRREYRCD